jgi:hypothetical protein
MALRLNESTDAGTEPNDPSSRLSDGSFATRRCEAIDSARTRRFLTVGAIALSIVVSGSALADPQGNASLTIGVAGRGYHRRIWDKSEFHLGLHGDVLFGRSNTRSLGVGPYAEVLTDGFDEIQAGVGASILLPVIDSLPIVLSAGPYARLGPGGFGLEPGIASGLFWGSRSYNFNANYVMAFGLFSQFRAGFGPSKDMTIIVGVQADLAFLALPIVYLVHAAKGGSRDTDTIPAEPAPAKSVSSR